MKQNEIWLINLDPAIGAEIKKTRPVVIVNDNAIGKLPLKIIVPITDWKENYTNIPWMIRIVPNDENGLCKLSSIDCFQIRNVSQQRFIKKIETIGEHISDKIKIDFYLLKESIIEWNVINLSGVIVKHETQSAPKGINSITLDNMSNLSNGIYFLKIKTSDKSMMLKLVKY